MILQEVGEKGAVHSPYTHDRARHYLFFLFLLLGALCFSTAARWQEEEEDGERDQNQVDGMQYLAYFFIAVAFVWLCLLICVRKRAPASPLLEGAPDARRGPLLLGTAGASCSPSAS